MLIAWEYDDSELRAEHFLTVAAYNLQHPAQFTDAALAGMQAVFIEHLDHGLGIAEIRRRVGKAAAGATRVLKPEAEQRLILRPWAMTIADVYLPDQLRVLPSGCAPGRRSSGVGSRPFDQVCHRPRLQASTR